MRALLLCLATVSWAAFCADEKTLVAVATTSPPSLDGTLDRGWSQAVVAYLSAAGNTWARKQTSVTNPTIVQATASPVIDA